jgi:hypothetical protein
LSSQRQTAGKQVSAAEQRLREERSQLPGLYRQMEASGNDEDKALRRMDIEKQFLRIQEAERALDEARGHARGLELQQAQRLNQQGQQRLSLLQAESSRLQDIIRSEKEREFGRRESFGLSHVRDQRTALAIGRKLANGQNLTQREVQFARGMPEIFGQRLHNLAMQRTGAGSTYDQLRKLLPELGARQANAEKALAGVQQQFKTEINFNPKETADHLAEKVLPALRQAQVEMEARLAEQIRRLDNQRWVQNRAMNQGL